MSRATTTKPGTKPAAGKPTTNEMAATRARKTHAVAPGTRGKTPKKAQVRTHEPPVTAPRTLTEFMAQAWLMEIEAAQRYTDFADAMEVHNNLEVAAMFRTMANYESKHADQIMAEMGWTDAPPITPRSDGWPGYEAPETTPGDEVHYLMQPWHALQLALAAEQRAEQFFAELARVATLASVRKAAVDLQAEEREHVELVRAWMNKVPQPAGDWSVDPDPPHYTD